MTIDDGGQRSLRPACAPIDTEAPRFKVLTVTGYAIHPGWKASGNARLILSATVFDRFYMREIVTIRSTAMVPGKYPGRRYGLEGALAAALARCAELNAWHEREGWGEDDPPEALSRCQGQAARAG